MTREEKQKAIDALKISAPVKAVTQEEFNDYIQTLNQVMDWLEQEPCDDAISRQDVLDIDFKKIILTTAKPSEMIAEKVRALPPAIPQQKTGQYEKHIDHTDCIWYGNDSGCPVTCSQYRDGWNDAMDYIFKNGKGYQPYRHDG